ncbi:helix-turn-helix domain-containing protein [Bradyrhizobium canariense]|uniref:helix-turn-helix domain-containing protein n=1 Tax=Bradyrhizobium canariense TaxID=255045 RepID=UPI000A18ADFC|nr:hypothetical protein [Bradyrhizobium canariense]OSI24804.1 hypothetical protein BST65_16680 [Bradyrhizobium canariense]OSI33265.1 hypothetical protein BST66_14120 [Bradyrhizobium canariense]OSI48072.1 hypothetical protein BSZ20_08020 [Bradyrhizobium canariense]OSI48638.1 hypothetical protein BST67_18410 [Bradyrhizobium canariense]OSI58596.1 hypothetical protein BSZ15_08820 [Bradyrhizobium canariense]
MIDLDQRQACELAQIVDCDPAAIHERTYRQASRRGGIVFFGTTIGKKYRETTVRRVSPRALDLERYHRAVWELRPFCFDPQTKELLLDTCPNCGKPLGWKEVHAPQHCEKCVDARGRPIVDLRDFPQGLVQVEDEEALDFVTALVDPDHQRGLRARQILPESWQEISNSDIFETILAMTTGLREGADVRPTSLARGKSLSNFTGLTAELLALAGRAVIGSAHGFSALAARYRAHTDSRPGFYGNRKELGQLGRLPSDDALPESVRLLLKKYIEAEMAENGQFHRVFNDQVEGRDFLPTYRLAKRLGVRKALMERLAKSGFVKTIHAKASAKRSPVQMSLSDVLPLVERLNDAICATEAAKRLGLPRYSLPNLADFKLLIPLSGPILGLLPDHAGYTRTSVMNLHERIWSLASPAPTQATVSLPLAARRFGKTAAPWAAIFSAIVAKDVEVFRGSDKRGTLRQSLTVGDLDAFVAGVRKHLSPNSTSALPDWIGAATCAELLGVNEPFFYRLVAGRPDVVRPRRQGKAPFMRSDIEALAQKVVFVPEAAQRIGEPVRRVRHLLEQFGIKPFIALQPNRDFGYLRTEAARCLSELNDKRADHLANLPEQSDDPRVNLIKAVIGGTSMSVAAKELQIDYGKARRWIDRWKKTGAVTDGKPHRFPPPELDDYVDFALKLFERTPKPSLPEVMAAFAERGITKSSLAVSRFLARHGLKCRDIRSESQRRRWKEHGRRRRKLQ